MHSSCDQMVGIDNAARIFQTAPHPKSFLSLDPADHLLSEPTDSHYAGEMIATWASRFTALPESQNSLQMLPEVIDNPSDSLHQGKRVPYGVVC